MTENEAIENFKEISKCNDYFETLEKLKKYFRIDISSDLVVLCSYSETHDFIYLPVFKVYETKSLKVFLQKVKSDAKEWAKEGIENQKK